ncbi:hypothetical protein [Nocardiopsis sp. NRRL B-16309]|uniref:hypothetical protein n=1 Tax=Nocardiopsis sp. NRRL B-16309 TaxID=1519494 RepID=UPI0006AF9480|nr:hypothetical protein [Nocardiopsis sp. NRRL B-16309]KOX17039.1 hypothetical protein ADL05_10730 [Nocardiopsis sp. NRRL B-16309]
MSTGAKIGLGCGGCLGVLVFLAIIGGCMAALSGDSTDTATPSTSSSSEAEEEPAEEPVEDEPAEESSGVTMTASDAGTVGDTIDDTVYTAIDIEIVNDSEESIEVNPVYFTVELADGTVVSDWSDSLFADIDPIDAVTVQPGQRASGQIAVVGEVEVSSVTMEELFGLEESITAEVE